MLSGITLSTDVQGGANYTIAFTGYAIQAANIDADTSTPEQVYNMIGDYTDFYGNTFQILIESDYARAYREKHREHCHRSYAKKRVQKLSAKQYRDD